MRCYSCRHRLLGAVAALAALAACGTARVLEQTRAGGTIELQGDHNKAMEQANETMATHCGSSNFTVLSEGAEPVDPAAARAQNAETSYRVRYQCGDGTSVAAPAAPAPGS